MSISHPLKLLFGSAKFLLSTAEVRGSLPPVIPHIGGKALSKSWQGKNTLAPIALPQLYRADILYQVRQANKKLLPCSVAQVVTQRFFSEGEAAHNKRDT